MTLKQALLRASGELIVCGIEDASPEAEVLLRHILQIDRVKLYQEIDRELKPAEEEVYMLALERRCRGEPSAYITGHREFYGLDFCVDKRVLIPRPESELLVELVLSSAQKNTFSTIADVGTGCGAIAICLAVKLAQSKIYAIDLSEEALEVALINCRKHGFTNRVCLLQGDMLSPLPEPVSCIVANLPYVKREEVAGVSSGYEPALALDGGSGGLDRILRLCRQVRGKLLDGGCLYLEVGQGQSKAVAGHLRNLFPAGEVAIVPDLRGIDRVVSLKPAGDKFFQKH